MDITVLIADDEPLVRAGIRMLLQGQAGITVVAEAADGAAAVDSALALRPTIAVMDVRMPVKDGVQATREILADPTRTDDRPPVAVLAMSTFNVDRAVYAALRAGASGFLLKDAAARDLVPAIRAIAEGDAWLDPAVAGALISEFTARTESDLPPPEDLALLTPREREVLVLVAHGLNNAEIAARLVIGEGTVKTHLSRTFMKLGLRDRAQAVATAYRTGLVGPRDPLPRR